jgi:hypothetical protein
VTFAIGCAFAIVHDRCFGGAAGGLGGQTLRIVYPRPSMAALFDIPAIVGDRCFDGMAGALDGPTLRIAYQRPSMAALFNKIISIRSLR